MYNCLFIYNILPDFAEFSRYTANTIQKFHSALNCHHSHRMVIGLKKKNSPLDGVCQLDLLDGQSHG